MNCEQILVGQHQMPKLQQFRGIRHRLIYQVNSHEVAQRLTNNDGVLQRLVSKPTATLMQEHPPHPGHTYAQEPLGR